MASCESATSAAASASVAASSAVCAAVTAPVNFMVGVKGKSWDVATLEGAVLMTRVKRDLVMLSLSSSGQDGPDSHFAGYAPLFGAWGGLGWMSGYTDGPPVEMRHVMDHSAGMHAALATLAAHGNPALAAFIEACKHILPQMAADGVSIDDITAVQCQLAEPGLTLVTEPRERKKAPSTSFTKAGCSRKSRAA